VTLSPSFRRTAPALALSASIAIGCACARRAPAANEPAAAIGHGASDSAAVARAIEHVVTDSFFGAITSFDFAQLLRAVTPGFELAEDTLRFSGPAFVEYLRPYVGQFTMRYRFEGFHTRLVGATAWTTYWNHGTLTPAGGGAAAEFHWLETAVLVRPPEGGWRIDRLHSTPKR
jgi:hypothetical protein